jgi:hypothetical protein
MKRKLMTAQIGPPTPRPCASCPYRCDVPSGVWAASEYEKLREYDLPTQQQPMGVFLCHQDAGAVCAGWAGCHDGAHLLALRLAICAGRIDAETLDAILDYESPVPLFESGNAAADHGEAHILDPDGAAVNAIAKIARRRNLPLDTEEK